jgi:hypothetical protein
MSIRGIFKFISRVMLSVIVLSIFGIAILLGLAPHDNVSRAFSQYKIAYQAEDGMLIAALTAPAHMEKFESQWNHALNSERAIVEALPFEDRLQVFSLRQGVLNGTVTVPEGGNLDAAAALAATCAVALPHPQVVRRMNILFVVPTGAESARAYMTPPDIVGNWFASVVSSVQQGVAFDFKKIDEKWLVSPAPYLASQAAQLQPIARRLEPTGNRFIFKLFLGVKGPDYTDKLWRPLKDTNT